MPRRVLRFAPYRVMALLVAVAVAATLTFYMQRAQAVITTPFTETFSANANGSIVMRGNANLICPSGTAGCTDALRQVGPTNTEALNNNGYTMQNLDVDADPGTFNSSTSDVTLPAGSKVLFAGLYWSAYVTAGTGGSAAPTSADTNKVKFSVPGTAGYTLITTPKTYVSGNSYQSYANVTTLVAGAGNGTYGVADIQAGTGQDRYAGWALVIAYQNAAEPMRNLRVYDGYGVVSSGSTSVNIPISGFQTPQYGTVTTRIGTVVYEGDLGKVGDQLQLDGTAMSDTQNPVNNFFNSTVSEADGPVGSRNPNNLNLLGVDIDQFDASGRLGNNVTSASLTLTTGGETFFPGVVTFTTDLYAPDLTATMTGSDVDGGQLLPGDVIEYTIDVKNNGTDSSIESVLTDAVPAGTTYVPGSLQIAGVSRSDAGTDDTAEFTPDSAQGTATFRLGTGADTTTGGKLIPNATAQVKLRVKVNYDTPGGYVVTNLANVSYTGEHTSRKIAGTSSAAGVTVVRPSADLAAGLTVGPARVQQPDLPGPVTYQLAVTNNGPQLEPAATGRLTLPAGVTGGAMPAGCVLAGQLVTCTMGNLAPGSFATRAIPATVAASAASSSVATAEARGLGLDSDPSNDTRTATLQVNRAPIAAPDTATTTNGTLVTVDVLNNDTDADDAVLTTTVLSQPAHGLAVANSDGSIRYTPTLGYRGTDTFPYRVLDGRGGTADSTVTVTVQNAVPIAAPAHAAGPPNQPVTLDVLTAGSDPNGDPRVVTAVTQPGLAGTVTFTGSTVTFTPTASFGGTASFTYTVSDDAGGSAIGSVTVDVDNAAPAAADDTVTTPYRTDLVVDVRAGDTDPNNDPLTVTAVTQPAGGTGTVDLTGGVVTYRPPAGFSGPATFMYTISDGHGGTATGTVHVTVGNAPPFAADLTANGPFGQPVVIDWRPGASDPNNDPLRVSGGVSATHGTVAVRPDGKLVFTPEPFWSGTDTFDYTITDDNGGTDVGRVTVTVANGPPVAHADSVTAETNLALLIPVLANDTDPNNDPLGVTVVAQPLHGSVAVQPDGQVRYTPNPGYQGSDSFSYQVADGRGGTDQAPVAVTVVNTPPVAHDDADTTPTNIPVIIDVLANDNDASGDPLTVTGFTSGGNGTVTQSSPGHLRYAPDAGFWGSDTFTYTVEDPAHGSSTATVTVTVQNAPPIANDDLAVVRPTVSTPVAVLANDTDPNTGQALRVLSVTQPLHGITAVNPQGVLTYTPTLGYTGTDSFTYTVTDDSGGTDTGNVSVTVDALPVAAPDTASAASGTAVPISVTANDSDPEGSALTLVSASDPPHGTTTVVGNTVRYTPDAGYAGTDTFTYVVRDGTGGTSTGTVTVTVANAPPVAAPDQAAVAVGSTVDVDVLANDTDVNPGQTLTVTAVTGPAHGTAVRRPDNTIRYTPAPGWSGSDQFTYTVSDGHGGTATETVTVVTTSAAPAAVADSAVTPYKRAVSIPVLANDVDPNNRSLTVTAVTQPAKGTVTYTAGAVRYVPPTGFSGDVSFTYTLDNGYGQTATATVTVTVGTPPAVTDESAAAKPGTPVTIPLPLLDRQNRPVDIIGVGQPSHGTVKLGANGKVTYTPDPGFAGTDSFTYSAQDANGNIASGTVKVNVAGANKPPTATDDRATAGYGKPVVVKPLLNDRDPDGNKLKVTAVGRPRHGTAVLNADGTVTYTPAEGYGGGVDSFSYKISDGRGGTDTAVIRVTLEEAPPALTVKLPKTGSDVFSVVGAGLLALLVGAILYWASMTSPPGGAAFAFAGGRGRAPGRHRPGRHAAGYNSHWT